ncbi:MAG: Mut7-C RNAse domain-containing protein [Candidatus Methanomethyliaceae archaeon]|nr:Mut7-C RNAse domain-containing protein [Candidatus Methanomethyliaceae archaeon]MCX8169577.1 Mut7-C RNAse domain-containing protein [Candidatus Methanomethyliaceae archaeon]MDW7970959.1 Mut7-C RNAse domain-containing protein [Nitrososphaerota archaeon]
MVDAMLGRLARWLRLLGFDTIYNRDFDDETLINIAKNEGRILLTRDETLFKRALKENIKSFLIRSFDVIEIISKLNLYIDDSLIGSRCTICNTQLVSDASSRKCPNCGKIYWYGSHWKDINRRIRAIKGDSFANT